MDFNLVQALHETRELAEARGGEAWSRLGARIEEVLDLLDADADDPIAPDMRMGRIDRDQIDRAEAERAVAALIAVHDREDDGLLEVAHDVVQDLRDAIG